MNIEFSPVTDLLLRAAQARRERKQGVEAENKMLRKTVRQLDGALAAANKQDIKMMKRLAQKEAIIVDLMAMDHCPHFENGDALEHCPLKEPAVNFNLLFCDNCSERPNCSDDHSLGLGSIAPYGGSCYVTRKVT